MLDSEGSPLRRVAEDDVERRGELADLGTLERREVDGHGIAGLRVLEFLIDEVACVARLALDVALGGEELLVALLDLEVDVGRTAGVRDRLDRAEVVLAAGTREEPAESLEVAVVLLSVGVARVDVGPVAVDLPDLDEGVADRVAPGVEDPPPRWVTSPTPGVMLSFTINRSLSVSSGSLLG